MSKRLTPERLEEIRTGHSAGFWWENLFSHIDAIEAELATVLEHEKRLLYERDTVNARCAALYERKLPCREAEVAQARYEAAEAERDRLRDALPFIRIRRCGYVDALEPSEPECCACAVHQVCVEADTALHTAGEATWTLDGQAFTSDGEVT
jgi:hypothetical protein